MKDKNSEGDNLSKVSGGDTVVIGGFAKLPETITGRNSCSFIAIEFKIDPADSKVLDVYCTLLPFVEKEILHQACMQRRIDEGIKTALEQVNKRFFGTTKKALMTALEDAHKCYKKFVEHKKAHN